MEKKVPNSSNSGKPYKKGNFIYYPNGTSDSYGNSGRVWWYGTPEQREAVGFAVPGQEAATKPAWVDGTSSSGQATAGSRAPITAILLDTLASGGEDSASVDTKSPGAIVSGSNRPVVDRTTGIVRREPDDEELRRGGALLLR